MRVLVLGGGGREHAIVKKLVESPKVSAVLCARGNGGTAGIAENVIVDIEDPKAVADLVAAHRSGRRDFSLHIWALLVFEAWCAHEAGPSVLSNR